VAEKNKEVQVKSQCDFDVGGKKPSVVAQGFLANRCRRPPADRDRADGDGIYRHSPGTLDFGFSKIITALLA